MSNISEFERNKPRVTMKNLKKSINQVFDRMAHAESHSEQIFLSDLHKLLTETLQNLKKGE